MCIRNVVNTSNEEHTVGQGHERHSVATNIAEMIHINGQESSIRIDR